MASAPRSWPSTGSRRSISPGRSPRRWRAGLRNWRTARGPDGGQSPAMDTLEVAVVGSGPAGLYTAEALIKQAAAVDPDLRIRVDVIDRLPTPYGLVRYGVAPDHKSIKSIADYLRGVLEHEGVSFLGGVRLGIPGEDLPGSFAATDFVNWYCGHPDIDPAAFTLDAESVAVIGVGNVAVDVARILARDPEELHTTDVPQPVL